MDKKNILVLGCGGDIGQSIIKILRDIDFIGKICGTDIHDKHPGIFLTDFFSTVDRVDANSYIHQIEEIICNQNIEILMPASEPELRHHSQFDIYGTLLSKYDLKIIMPNSKSMHIGFDKLKTSNFLKENNLPFPLTFLLENFHKVQIPCILKNRFGAGSKGVYKIFDKLAFEYYSKLKEELIYQEYIEDTEGEFTCGLFKADETIRTILMKRTLHGGYSGYGEIVENTQIENLLVELAKNIELRGSINVQLRLKNTIPLIFEINPRFSSTVLFRHLFGFKDLLWCIQDKLGYPIEPYTKCKTGSKFYKGYQEYIKI